jgi:hypothetical protein
MNLKCRIWDEKFNCWDTEPALLYPCTELKKQGRSIQLFTGITDSKGVEIYEGDIVSTIYQKDAYNFIGEVIFSLETCSFRIKTLKGLLPIVTFRFVEEKPAGLISVAHEVVGNIFQLPCKPDHNGECFVCDCWMTDCQFSRGKQSSIK